jgi:ferredoxin
LTASGAESYFTVGMPKVTFVNEHRIVEVEKGRNVRDVALECGIDVNNSEEFRGINCGGHGFCTTCMCWVEELSPGAGGPRSFAERLRMLGGWRRLACRTRLEGDVKVYSHPGQHERTRKQRPISPPPRPATDPTAARKPIDASSGAAFLYGHPSMVASGTRKPPEKPAVAAPAVDKDKDEAEDGEEGT